MKYSQIQLKNNKKECVIDAVILFFFKARHPASGWMSEVVRGRRIALAI